MSTKVYDFAEWSGESSSEDEAKEEENFQDQAEDAATKDTKQWTWDMSFQVGLRYKAQSLVF